MGKTSIFLFVSRRPLEAVSFIRRVFFASNSGHNALNGQLVKIDQIGKSRTGTLTSRTSGVRRQACHHSLSSSRTPHQHPKIRHTINGNPASVTPLIQVTPGHYTIRHETISPQLTMTLGGAEFYPPCTQIHVGGSQMGTPNQTTFFPGAYNDNDPGIYDPRAVSDLASPADMAGQLSGNGSSATCSCQTLQTCPRYGFLTSEKFISHTYTCDNSHHNPYGFHDP